MSRVAQHLRVGIALLSVLLLICLPLQATAASPSFLSSSIPKVIITELQTAGDTSSQEFIEIYNLTDVDIDFADTVHGGKELWKLQFFSAANTSTGAPDWSKPSATISLQGTIPAGGYYLLASTGYLPGGIDADQEYNPRLSDTGGGLQIVTTTTTTTTAYDHLMWKQSSADKPLVRGQWPTPAAKASLQRLPNDEDLYQNTDNSLTDFVAAAEISPKDMWHPVVVEEIVPIEPTTPPIDEEEPIGLEEPSIPEIVGNPAELMSPYLTELLPNPAAPLKDETDEFIELYNPNEAAFNLKGYTLEVGTTTLHDFTFTEDFIVPGRTYTAFYSKDTRLSLTNTGGQARLLGLEGNVLSESQPYTSADDGMAWVFADGIWQWSANATPGLINSVTALTSTVKPAAAPKSTAKKATAKKAAAKVKGASTIKLKKPTTKKAKKPAKPKVATVVQTAEKPPRAPIHNGILVAVAGVAVLYAAYEYRHDVSNRIYKLRNHRAIRFLTRK